MSMAVEEMARQLVESRLRALERQRTASLISWIDGMLSELEVLNLGDVPTVPAAWQGRLATLFASLPVDYRPSLGAFPWSPTEVLDTLFDVQGLLFDIKNGRTDGWAPLDEPRAFAS